MTTTATALSVTDLLTASDMSLTKREQGQRNAIVKALDDLDLYSELISDTSARAIRDQIMSQGLDTTTRARMSDVRQALKPYRARMRKARHTVRRMAARDQYLRPGDDNRTCNGMADVIERYRSSHDGMLPDGLLCAAIDTYIVSAIARYRESLSGQVIDHMPASPRLLARAMLSAPLAARATAGSDCPNSHSASADRPIVSLITPPKRDRSRTYADPVTGDTLRYVAGRGDYTYATPVRVRTMTR